MDQRKKILLGNKDILSRTVQDFYVDINLSRDNKEIIPYKYDNIFDLTKFYDQERNGSRNFIIYGTIDSYIYDCNNFKIDVYQSESLNQQDYLCTTHSEDIVNNGMQFKNIYNKLKGKYIIDNIPITFTGYSVYLKIQTQPPLSYSVVTASQQLIFTTLTLSQTGEKVIEQLKYGLNEAVTDCDGNIIEVNNDFDFFYNKHWIKKNLYFLNLKTIWIGNINDITCLKEHGVNNGMMHYNTQIEVYEQNGEPTGNIRPNSGITAIADSYNDVACPLGLNKLTVIVSPMSAGTFSLTPRS